ncbi:unannotated protein [freshwater metagenome]|uniref:Unannotated protein n=1 Tax=freshwater metagenome TaxID=449393 RepID=A0A6J6X6I8_9ZZZZ
MRWLFRGREKYVTQVDCEHSFITLLILPRRSMKLSASHRRHMSTALNKWRFTARRWRTPLTMRHRRAHGARSILKFSATVRFTMRVGWHRVSMDGCHGFVWRDLNLMDRKKNGSCMTLRMTSHKPSISLPNTQRNCVNFKKCLINMRAHMAFTRCVIPLHRATETSLFPMF